MIQQIRIAPPNSLILVMDQSIGDIPVSMGDGRVAATESCIAVGTLCHIDGETWVGLSGEGFQDAAEYALVFDGSLKTPSRRLSICNVYLEEILGIDAGAQTRVRIWTNDESEPDRIRISTAA